MTFPLREKELRGAVAYHSGLAAEEAVARDYGRRGRPIAARRWRGRGGEVDLIARDGDAVIFIEVKRAKSFARAAERLGPGQQRRLHMAAQEYLAGEPRGLLTDARFDVALVDGQGQIQIIENALGF